jgi:hypothetical protein
MNYVGIQGIPGSRYTLTSHRYELKHWYELQ